MPGLVDIAPLHEVVDIRGTPVTVTGVPADGIARLLMRFPELRKALAGGNLEIDAQQLIDMGGEIVSAVIAAGTENEAPQEEVEEAIRKNTALEEQVKLLAAVIRVTLPNGVGPFVESLEDLSGVVEAAGGGASPKAPGTKSRKR